MIKRAENAIFRRAISAIKPKTIEIKLRPERRVLLDPAAATETATTTTTAATATVVAGAEAADYHKSPPAGDLPSPDASSLSLRALQPGSSPADAASVADEKKKSVRDRLGDKVEPSAVSTKGDGSVDKSEEAGKETSSKSRHKDKSNKKDRRTPSKDKVLFA